MSPFEEGEEFANTKEWNWEGEKSSFQALQVEQKNRKNLDVIMPATSSELLI